MVLDVECHLEVDPGSSARAPLEDLAYFGYDRSTDVLVKV